MNDRHSAYGSLVTGKVIPARAVAGRVAGDITKDQMAPEVPGSLDPNEWVPGVVTADGKFHPGDQGRQPPAGRWVVEFRDFGQTLSSPGD
jgi:hypothetical protein